MPDRVFQSKTRRLVVCAHLLMLVVIPAALYPGSAWLRVTFAWSQLCVFLLVLTGLTLLRRRSASPTPSRLLAIGAGSYYAAIYLQTAYGVYTGSPFDVRFALDSLGEIAPTLLAVFGWATIALVVSFAAIWAAASWSTLRLKKDGSWPIHHLRPGFLIIVLGIAILTTPGGGSFFGHSVRDLFAVVRYGGVVVPLGEDMTLLRDAPPSEENLFFLQLESVNAVAAFGQAVLRDAAYPEIYVPELQKMTKQGVLLPFTWGNAVQTSRSLAAVLCGVTNNIGAPLILNPGLIRQPCLPELLKTKGFTSLYFQGGPYPYFHNTKGFAEEKGFDKFLALEVMPDDYPKTEWGFPECEFFERTLDYLATHHPNPTRIFGFITVHRNHYPFTDDGASSTAPLFEKPKNFVERYLNSLSQQDACLPTFWDAFAEYAGDNSHLFVYGDHSFPVGINGSTSNQVGAHAENFLVPLLYIPPRARWGEVPVGRTLNLTVGQTDISPTVLELLGIGTGGNSFAGALRGDPSPGYENCHVLVQPYTGSSVTIVRGSDKYTYELERGSIAYSDLSDSFLEQDSTILATGVSYEAFVRDYGCERYAD